jgi:citrate synthase
MIINVDDESLLRDVGDMHTDTIALPTPLPIPPGLKGVVVGTTTIGDVQGARGFYHYRQYSATDLARTRSFEDVWALVVDGELPGDRAAARRFLDETARQRTLPSEVLVALPAVVAASAGGVPLAGLRSALSLHAAATGMRPVLDLDPAEQRREALRIAATTPVLVAALHRVAHGQEPVASRPELGMAADLLWMLTGVDPDPVAVHALEAYLVSTIDHGYNASTFTARVVASTGADMGSCVVAALGALSGPLHGGAPSRALALLDTIRSAGTGTDHIDLVVRSMLERGERIMGFGHAVYRTEDPRSALLSEMADRLAVGSADAAERVALAHAVESRVQELLEEHRPGRALRTNVEFYAAVVLEMCGIPPELFSSVFASSRVVGWTAHVLEQAAAHQIIRPSAQYVGPTAPQPVPSI